MKKILLSTLLIFSSFQVWAENEWYASEVLVKFANVVNTTYGTGHKFSKGWGLESLATSGPGILVKYKIAPDKVCQVMVVHSKLANGKDNLNELIIDRKLSNCPTR